MITKINIDEHLVEYCIGKWGSDFTEPVRFPSNSDLYVSVYDLTQKRPVNIFVDSGNLEIVIPNRRENEDFDVRKNPDVYNYISSRSSKILNSKIQLHFWVELHELLDHEKHNNGFEYLDTIHYFLCKYHIESVSEDRVLKNFYRWREKLRKKNKRSYQKK